MQLDVAEQVHEVNPGVRRAQTVAVLDPLKNRQSPGVKLFTRFAPPAEIPERAFVGDHRLIKVESEDRGQELARQGLELVDAVLRRKGDAARIDLAQVKVGSCSRRTNYPSRCLQCVCTIRVQRTRRVRVAFLADLDFTCK